MSQFKRTKTGSTGSKSGNIASNGSVSLPKKRAAAATVGRGRPSTYSKDHDELAFKLCILGATDALLAGAFGVSQVTIDNWKKKHASFSLALRAGKVYADSNVAHSLYQRAIGIEIEEWREALDKDGTIVKLRTTKQIPGDVHAQRFWLKNRQPENWRENVEISSDSGGGFQLIIHEELNPDHWPRKK